MQKSVRSVGAGVNSDGSPLSHSISPHPPSNILTAEQCQQLLSYLQSQIQDQAISSESAPVNSSTGSSDFSPSFNGMFTLTSIVASAIHSKHIWLIDTGATYHVCCSSSQFIYLTNLSDAFVTLPNTHKVLIASVGTINLTPSLKCYADRT